MKILKGKYLNYKVYSIIVAIGEESMVRREESEHICFCPLKGVIDVISKKWALLIINAIGNHGRLRFNRLMEELNGISPKTLSDTLKKLEAEGLVNRESFAEIPPRVEYTLTKDGTELRKAIIPLLRWAAKRNGLNKDKCVPIYQKIPAHKVEIQHKN
jgi:DNA-binding HxlR family transcriptional regulator